MVKRIVRRLDLEGLYLGTVAGIGLLLLGFSLPLLPLYGLPLLIVLAFLCAAAQRYPIATLGDSQLSVAFAPAFASLVLLGPAAALWVNLASGVTQVRRSRRKMWPQGLFYLGSLTFAMAAAGALYRALGGSWPLSQSLEVIPAMALAALSYFAVNTVLVAGGIGLSSGQPWPRIWRANYLGLAGHYLGTALSGAALAAGYQVAGWFGLAVFVLPLVLSRHWLRLYMNQKQAEPAYPIQDFKIALGETQVDVTGRRAMQRDRWIHLTPTEWKVLEALLRHAGTPLSYSQLAQEALGYAAPDEEARDILKVHIHNLRQKLEPRPSVPSFILTVPGFGYTFRNGQAMRHRSATLASPSTAT